MHFLKSTCCLLTASLLLCTAAGCSRSKSGQGNTGAEKLETIVHSSAVTEAPTNPPPTEHEAHFEEQIGDEEIGITIHNVYSTDFILEDTDATITPVFFEATIANHSDRKISFGLFSGAFGVQADGESFPGHSVRMAHFVAAQFGEDANCFINDIPAGETQTGYICMEVPADFNELDFYIYPRAAERNFSDVYNYHVTRADMTPAGAPVNPY